MKYIQFLLSVLILSFVLVACKEQEKKVEKVTLNVTGMTCEIGCARTIQSKLSKKEGVKKAEVSFKDNKAVIEYDPAKVSKADLSSFIGNIGGGKSYKASEVKSETPKSKEKASKAKSCGAECTKSCCSSKKESKPCNPKECTKPCCNKV